jgi:hypothetical protein
MGPFASNPLPAHTEVTTHAVVSPVHRITQVNLPPVKQWHTPVAYFSSWKVNADMKVDAAVIYKA